MARFTIPQRTTKSAGSTGTKADIDINSPQFRALSGVVDAGVGAVNRHQEQNKRAAELGQQAVDKGVSADYFREKSNFARDTAQRMSSKEMYGNYEAQRGEFDKTLVEREARIEEQIAEASEERQNEVRAAWVDEKERLETDFTFSRSQEAIKIAELKQQSALDIAIADEDIKGSNAIIDEMNVPEEVKALKRQDRDSVISAKRIDNSIEAAVVGNDMASLDKLERLANEKSGAFEDINPTATDQRKNKINIAKGQVIYKQNRTFLAFQKNLRNNGIYNEKEMSDAVASGLITPQQKDQLNQMGTAPFQRNQLISEYKTQRTEATFKQINKEIDSTFIQKFYTKENFGIDQADLEKKAAKIMANPALGIVAKNELVGRLMLATSMGIQEADNRWGDHIGESWNLANKEQQSAMATWAADAARLIQSSFQRDIAVFDDTGSFDGKKTVVEFFLEDLEEMAGEFNNGNNPMEPDKAMKRLEKYRIGAQRAAIKEALNAPAE